MKKLFILLLIGLFLSGCGSSSSISSLPEDDMTDGETSEWLGTWIRQATYTGGELVTTEPATLTLNPETYSSSTAACATSGLLIPDGEAITLTMTESNCPGNISLPFSVTYTYTIEENEEGEEIMTIVTGPVTEIYKR